MDIFDCEALFKTCDQEGKGFITKRDMLRCLRSGQMEEFDPEQLEDVFDTLDVDRNGYLTLNEARANLPFPAKDRFIYSRKIK